MGEFGVCEGGSAPQCRAAACHSACDTITESESLGPEGPKNQQAICRCHMRAKSICHTGFLKEWSLEQSHRGHHWGLVKSVNSAFKQISQVALLLGVRWGILVTAKLTPWQRIEPEIRRAG